MTKTIIIKRPDDWHVHLRDGAVLSDTVPATARHFNRALVMPNLNPALTSLQDLRAYRARIMQVLPHNSPFNPLMTFYLNERVNPQDLLAIKPGDPIVGAKLYPKGATTNSQEGAHSIKALYPLFDIMQQQDLVLQLHGETTCGDIFDREAAFVEEILIPLVNNFPTLRIVLEHVSTKTAVDFVSQAPQQIAATITPHHLLYNRNHLLAGGIKPHYYCLPILKRESSQIALQQAACSGNPKFFAGTDSAPHSQANKESACGCAGIYSAPYAVALYAQVFDNLHQLNRLDDFMGRFGAEFYQQPLSAEQLVLVKKEQSVPHALPLGIDTVVPIAAGEFIPWSVHD